MWGNVIKKRLMSFTVEKTPRISLSCMLVPVQYREYEYGLLHNYNVSGEMGVGIYHIQALGICVIWSTILKVFVFVFLLS